MTSNENAAPKNSLPIEDSAPNVPTFTCLVYLSQDESGATKARVANLECSQAICASPRDAMAQVCREFKARVRGAYATGETIDWIEPPAEPLPDEQVRSIPVHL
jgi:hypothetical protein